MACGRQPSEILTTQAPVQSITSTGGAAAPITVCSKLYGETKRGIPEYPQASTEEAPCVAGDLINFCIYRFLCGGPGRSPTCDLRVRSALLYATELPGHLTLSVAHSGFIGRGGVERAFPGVSGIAVPLAAALRGTGFGRCGVNLALGNLCLRSCVGPLSTSTLVG